MNKEHFKSILLSMLVIANLFLGSRILMTKKLWPDGYNFFINMKKTEFYNSILKLFSGSSFYTESKSHISAPNGMIINTGYQTTRFSLKTSHEKFEKTYSVCSDILKRALSEPQKNWSQVTSEEWYASLSGKSVYMSYSSGFDSALFAEFAGSDDSEIPMIIDDINNVVISAETTPTVYLQGGNTYIKCSIDSDVSELAEVIEYFQQDFAETDANSSIINYSFELLFDKEIENQNAVLESMIPIYSNPVDYYTIVSDNPLQKNDSSINSNVVDRISSLFEINSNSVRRYTEAGGTIVFVENNGTLKIHPDGYIEYNASNGANGLKLTDSINTYDNICAAADFMDNINTTASADKNMTITSYVSSANNVSGTANMTFNYVVDGMPVEFSSEGISSAVYISVENGYLKQYKHLLRSYDVTDQTQQTPLYIQELDKIISQNPDSAHTYIDKMYICYKDDTTLGEKHAAWHIEKGAE